MSVILSDGHLGQADHITSARLELAPHADLVAQAFGLLVEPLSPLGVLPDVGVF